VRSGAARPSSRSGRRSERIVGLWGGGRGRQPPRAIARRDSGEAVWRGATRKGVLPAFGKELPGLLVTARPP